MWTIQESYPDRPVLNKQINISLLFYSGLGQGGWGGWGGCYTKSSFKCFVVVCCCCSPSSPLAQGPTCLARSQLHLRLRQPCFSSTPFSVGPWRQSTEQCTAWPLPTCSEARSQNPSVLFYKRRWMGCSIEWPGDGWWRGCIWQRAGARSSRSPAAARSNTTLSEAWGAGARFQTPGPWSARNLDLRSSYEECHLRCSRTAPWCTWLSAGLAGLWLPAHVPRRCSPRTQGLRKPPSWRSAGRHFCSTDTYPDDLEEMGNLLQKCTWISGRRSSACHHPLAPGHLLSGQNPLPVSYSGRKEILIYSHKLYLRRHWKLGHLCSLGLSLLWYWYIWSAGHYNGHMPPAVAEYLQKRHMQVSPELPKQEKMGFLDQKQYLWPELGQISPLCSWKNPVLNWAAFSVKLNLLWISI